MGRIIPVTKADPVHHILPVSAYPRLRLRLDNCESHSFHCHEVEEGRAIDHEYETWRAGRGVENHPRLTPIDRVGSLARVFPNRFQKGWF
jgi:hypothetical protein